MKKNVWKRAYHSTWYSISLLLTSFSHTTLSVLHQDFVLFLFMSPASKAVLGRRQPRKFLLWLKACQMSRWMRSRVGREDNACSLNMTRDSFSAQSPVIWLTATSTPSVNKHIPHGGLSAFVFEGCAHLRSLHGVPSLCKSCVVLKKTKMSKLRPRPCHCVCVCVCRLSRIAGNTLISTLSWLKR